MSIALRDSELDQKDYSEKEYFLPEDFAGNKIPYIGLDVIEEHAMRKLDSKEIARKYNIQDRDQIKADFGNYEIHFTEYENNLVEIEIGVDQIPVTVVRNQILGKLENREKKTRDAARKTVNHYFDEFKNPINQISRELESRGGKNRLSKEYYSENSFGSRLMMAYSEQFELKPDQNMDDDFHDSLEGEIPVSSALEDVNTRDKGIFWAKRYLERVVELALDRSEEESEKEQSLRRHYIE